MDLLMLVPRRACVIYTSSVMLFLHSVRCPKHLAASESSFPNFLFFFKDAHFRRCLVVAGVIIIIVSGFGMGEARPVDHDAVPKHSNDEGDKWRDQRKITMEFWNAIATILRVIGPCIRSPVRSFAGMFTLRHTEYGSSHGRGPL